MNDLFSQSLQPITLTELSKSARDCFSMLFGTQVRDTYGQDVIDSVTVSRGYRALLLPGQIVELDRSVDFGMQETDEPELAWKVECSDQDSYWDRPVNWLSVLLAVHWSTVSPGLLIGQTGQFLASEDNTRADDLLFFAPARAEHVLSALHRLDGFGDHYYSQCVLDGAGRWGMLDCANEAFTILVAEQVNRPGIAGGPNS